jgi:hypothetical protein
MKNLHPTDREALASIVVLVSGVAVLVSALWLHAIASGQC